MFAFKGIGKSTSIKPLFLTAPIAPPFSIGIPHMANTVGFMVSPDNMMISLSEWTICSFAHQFKQQPL